MIHRVFAALLGAFYSLTVTVCRQLSFYEIFMKKLTEKSKKTTKNKHQKTTKIKSEKEERTLRGRGTRGRANKFSFFSAQLSPCRASRQCATNEFFNIWFRLSFPDSLTMWTYRKTGTKIVFVCLSVSSLSGVILHSYLYLYLKYLFLCFCFSISFCCLSSLLSFVLFLFHARDGSAEPWHNLPLSLARTESKLKLKIQKDIQIHVDTATDQSEIINWTTVKVCRDYYSIILFF